MIFDFCIVNVNSYKLQFHFVAEKQESRELTTRSVFDSNGNLEAMLDKGNSYDETNEAIGAKKTAKLDKISTTELQDYNMQPTNEYISNDLDMSADKDEKISMVSKVCFKEIIRNRRDTRVMHQELF